MAMNPQGVFLSNGPGDPTTVPYAVQAITELVGQVPVFGICLGHQLLSLALGGQTYKLPFGHHGGNHPVQHLASGHVEITSQNHNFCVDAESLGGRVSTTHINLNDKSNEGMRLDAHAEELSVFAGACEIGHDESLCAALVALDKCVVRWSYVDIESFLVGILKIRSIVAKELTGG